MSNIPGLTKTWTDADDAVLRQGCTDRLSFREIGALLGVSRRSAIGRAYRLGIKKGRVPQPPGTGARTNLREKIVRNVKAPIRLARKKGLPPLQFAPLPKAEPVVPAVEDIPIGPGRPLIDLPWNGCRFSVTQDDALEHLFCGAETAAEKPYCAAHCRIAYVPPRRPVWIPDEDRQSRKMQGLKNVAAGVWL